MDIPQRSIDMIRYIFLNKWFFCGLGFLVIFAGLCYIWLQHSIASYRHQILESEDVVLQTDISQKLHRSTEIKVSEAKVSEFKMDTSDSTKKAAVKSDLVVLDCNYITILF